VNELKAKCDQTEKRAQEQRQVEEKKHAEEIQFLKRTNQQLKVKKNNNIHNIIMIITRSTSTMQYTNCNRNFNCEANPNSLNSSPSK